MKTIAAMIAFAVVLAAAVMFGGRPTIVDPYGPNSGAGRAMMAAPERHPFSAEPLSGPGRTPWGDPASGPRNRLP